MRGPQPGPKPSNPGGIQASQGACRPLPTVVSHWCFSAISASSAQQGTGRLRPRPWHPSCHDVVAPLTRVNAERQNVAGNVLVRDPLSTAKPLEMPSWPWNREATSIQHQHTEHRDATCLPRPASRDRRRTGLWCLYLRGIHESYKVGGTHSTPSPNTQHPTP